MGFNIVKTFVESLNEQAEMERKQQMMKQLEIQHQQEEFMKINLLKLFAECLNKTPDFTRDFNWESLRIFKDVNNFVVEIPDTDISHNKPVFLNYFRKTIENVNRNVELQARTLFDEEFILLSKEIKIVNGILVDYQKVYEMYSIFFERNFFRLIHCEFLDVSIENTMMRITFLCNWASFWKYHPTNIAYDNNYGFYFIK